MHVVYTRWGQVGPASTIKSLDEVAQMPRASLSQHTYTIASGGFPISVDRGRGEAGLQMVLHDIQATPESEQPHSIALFWDIPEGRCEGKSSQWAELSAVYLVVHFV